MHFNLVIGTGLPFGPPDQERYKDVLKIPPYRRLVYWFFCIIIKWRKKLEALKNQIVLVASLKIFGQVLKSLIF